MSKKKLETIKDYLDNGYYLEIEYSAGGDSLNGYSVELINEKDRDLRIKITENEYEIMESLLALADKEIHEVSGDEYMGEHVVVTFRKTDENLYTATVNITEEFIKDVTFLLNEKDNFELINTITDYIFDISDIEEEKEKFEKVLYEVDAYYPPYGPLPLPEINSFIEHALFEQISYNNYVIGIDTSNIEDDIQEEICNYVEEKIDIEESPILVYTNYYSEKGPIIELQTSERTNEDSTYEVDIEDEEDIERLEIKI